MSIRRYFAEITPKPIKQILISKQIIRSIFYWRVKKYESELDYWRSKLEIDKGQFKNSYYKRLMLAMSEEDSDDFVRGKIVADFGCGPKGSLVWANSALLRIGIDVLADRFADEFTDNITSHGMIYLKSTENVIPLPSAFVDVMFTINAIDHVDNFHLMCNEIIRVLKPGGQFIASINLEEYPSPTEPQQLNERIIEEELLNKLKVHFYKITRKGPKGNRHAPFFDGNLSCESGQKGILWVRASKHNLQ